MSLVVCKLPKAGLGNQLFPLMRAKIFAHLNDLPIVVTGYHQLKIGPYLRGERSKRNYNRYFNFQKNIFGELSDQRRLRKNKALPICSEHSLEKMSENESSRPTIYLYDKIPHWSDYFAELKNFREIALHIFYGSITENIKKKISLQPAPCIGVHIRMGDFRKLKAGEDFSKVGAVRTPENYFIDVINNIRQIHGSKLPVSVFSDGKKNELQFILTMENISLVEGNPDIVDLILLSKSKIIIASAGSTFSYWAGFFANAPVILHQDHIHQSIRSTEINSNWYEGSWDSSNSLLIDNIKKINSDQ
ncbi:MAG TPA: alpha-1,2-fucosyltransferase [Puia sp.]|jgi:hypothetical protein|nr:alpha-1,2-fucosyltransferase [Puia sp.]